MNSKTDLFKECLSDTKAILDSVGQKFFLCAGTLLGQQRENNFILHDDDIDLGILSCDFTPQAISALIYSGKFKSYQALGERGISKEFSFKHRNGISIDIFLHYPVEGGGDDYYYYASFFGVCARKPEGFCKWGRHVSGFREINFMGSTYNIPDNSEQYLEEEYGSDWRTPKQFGYFDGLNGEYKNMLN